VSPSVSQATVVTGATLDVTAVVTGTSNKSVVWSVCNGNGANCVAGGNAVRGTIVQIGVDSQGNSIARYTAPATVPAPPDCQAEASGCSVVLQGFLTAFDVACFSRVTVEPGTNPVPTITSLSPPSTIVGGAAFTLTVNGTGYVPSSVVRWNGSDRTTTFLSSTQLQAAIPASDIAATGTADITVFNPPPDGGLSNPVAFAINNPVPALTLLMPSTALAGGTAFTLTVDGSGFVASSEVQWNGSPRTTTFVNATQVTADIPDTDIALVGTAMVTVVNPGPGGGTSNALTFTISTLNPVPVLTVLTPSTAVAGGGGFTLTVDGSNFITSSVVRWNGGDRTTTFINSTQLQAAIPASDIVVAGTAMVTVFNPGPGGGTSNALTFTVNNPVPFIEGLTPSTVLVGGGDFTLGVVGGNYRSTSVVRVNGNDRATTFISNAALEAVVLAADIAAAGTAQVTVFNPAPGGGTSNMAVLNINNPAPALTLLTPSSAVEGGAAFTLTVDGSGFIASSTVQWNGSNRTTTFVNSTQVTADIPDTDIAAAGTAMVTVVNSAPGGGTSNTLTFTINPAVCTVGVIGRANITSAGGEGNGFGIQPSINTNGRFIAFASAATNLVAGDTNGMTDIFVRDTCEGAGGCTPSTVRVSVDSSGNQADGNSFDNELSSTGRFIVFRSMATNLVPGDTNGTQDIFVHDRDADGNGTFDEAGGIATVRVSVASDGTQANPVGLGSLSPSMSADGRFVTFRSFADNLVAGDTNGVQDIFVHDRDADADGIFDEPGSILTFRVSVDSGGTEANGASGNPVMSADGRFVAFESSATNLVSGDTNGVSDVFVRDTCFGGPMGCTPSTFRVSLANDGSEANGTSFTGSGPHTGGISADGRFVAFESAATNLVAGDTNGLFDIFVRDTCLGAMACTPSTVRVNVASDGTEANNVGDTISITANGRLVAFESQATNLVSGDTNGFRDIFVRDRDTDNDGILDEPGAVATFRVSIATSGTEANSSSTTMALSADGRLVVFESGATTLIAGDTNATTDVFIAQTCAAPP